MREGPYISTLGRGRGVAGVTGSGNLVTNATERSPQAPSAHGGEEKEPAACQTQAPSFTELLLSLFVGCMTGKSFHR